MPTTPRLSSPPAKKNTPAGVRPVPAARARRRLTAASLVLLMMPLMLFAQAGTPPAADAHADCGLAGMKADTRAVIQSALRAELQQRINAARTQARWCGARAFPATAPLDWERRLEQAASAHASDMAVHNYFSHTSRDGRSLAQRVGAVGYGWHAVGENLAAGVGSAQGVIDGWLGSPGHCANLMSAEFTQVGVSCASQPGSQYDRYWVMVLARPS